MPIAHFPRLENSRWKILFLILYIQFYLVLFLEFFLIKKKKHGMLKQQRKKTDGILNVSLITMIIMERMITMKYEGEGLLHSVTSCIYCF